MLTWALIFAVIALVAGVFGRTLWGARLPLPARFVAVALPCVLATAVLGALFALLLSGYLPVLVDIDLRTHALPVHIAVGLGGWLSFTAIGVSYRLLPMFMLSPDKARRSSYAAWWTGAVALLLIAFATPFASLLGTPGIARILFFIFIVIFLITLIAALL